jgi:hypothetical protein
MSQTYEADVALMHIAGGAARITPPPGTLAQTAPRRSARGRSEDYLLLTLRLQSPRPVTPGHLDHLAKLSGEAFYGTPGTVTSALREAAAIVNDRLIDSNQSDEAPTHLQGSLLTAILRGGDLYIGQSGMGQAILIRPGQVVRFHSDEASQRPLGISLAPFVRYHHLEVLPGDLLILSSVSPELWSDSTLSGLTTLELDQAIDRLVAASNQDLNGLLARIVPQGQAGLQPSFSEFGSENAMGGPPAAASLPRGTIPRMTSTRRRGGPSLELFAKRLRARSTAGFTRVLAILSEGLTRLAPGLAEPLHPDALSRRILAATAIGVPVVIVSIAALIYFGKGRSEQFQLNLNQAMAAVAAAQLKESPDEARNDWENAMHYLNLSGRYGDSNQYQMLRQEVQEVLDELNLIVRLEFRPLVSGGFGSDAEITGMAASSTDIYILDAANQVIRHAWGTPERGFDIDSTFQCWDSRNTYDSLSTPLDIVVQRAPGALGAEGVVAIDEDGTLLYCAAERQPALAQLTPPDLGWGRIQAIDVFGDNLYILDPVINAVWIYEASGGFFSGTPELYFVEEVRDLKSAIDLALAQDELVILYADGRVDRCRRFREAAEEGGRQFRVECEAEPFFQDDRPGRESSAQIPGAVPVDMTYSAPPEPSLYFLDLLSNSVFHYSMRLVYQGQYLSTQPFDGEISAMTFGPPNDLYVAVGSQVYHTSPR